MAPDIALMDRDQVVDELVRVRSELREILNSWGRGEGEVARLRSLVPDERSPPPSIPDWNDVVATSIGSLAPTK